MPVLDPLHSVSAAFDKTITKDLDDPFGDLSYLPPPDPFDTFGLLGGKKKRKDKDEQAENVELSQQHYIFCDAMVKGYCLTSKQWGKSSLEACNIRADEILQ